MADENFKPSEAFHDAASFVLKSPELRNVSNNVKLEVTAVHHHSNGTPVNSNHLTHANPTQNDAIKSPGFSFSSSMLFTRWSQSRGRRKVANLPYST